MRSFFGSAVHPGGGAVPQSYLASSHPSKVHFFDLKTAPSSCLRQLLIGEVRMEKCTLHHGELERVPDRPVAPSPDDGLVGHQLPCTQWQ